MKVGLLLIFVIGIILIEPTFGRPEEGEENLVSRLKRGVCCHCACVGLSGRKKRSDDGQQLDHEMTKRFAPELELLSHYRNKRSPADRPRVILCCCICHETSSE
eukprot:GFUD01106641.1.p1 GENE.GFUD01106641.1~~GFUD01106641.1.p1  ORF type:complete len:104 (+),score=20.72 GFUD01106641.1:65-376(+)